MKYVKQSFCKCCAGLVRESEVTEETFDSLIKDENVCGSVFAGDKSVVKFQDAICGNYQQDFEEENVFEGN